ncbi:hemoglobin [Paraburkholderia sp. BL10I2N1]|nr:hemoglobin [Paraburkholderia sp. BL10I2N1]
MKPFGRVCRAISVALACVQPDNRRVAAWFGYCIDRAMDTPATQASRPVPRETHFDRLGGETAVIRLVDAFYRHMDTRADAQRIRAMHHPDLSSTKALLVLYLCEWLGADKRYSAQRGQPRLRTRHAAFAIGTAERDAWLACMRAAFDETGVDPVLRDELMQAFFKIADRMRNTQT